MKLLIFFLSIVVCSSPTWANWIEKGSDPAYPPELYFVGYGLSDQNIEKAKRQAQNDIQRQIRVSLHSKVVDQSYSETRKGKEFTYDQSNMNMFAVGMGEITGVQVVKTEENKGIFYALAALDKSLFAQNLKKNISDLNQSIETKFSKAESEKEQKKIAEAFRLFIEIQKELREVAELKLTLSAVETPGASLDSKVNDDLIENKIGSLLQEINVQIVMGNHQKMLVGEALNDPFVVSIDLSGTPVVGVEFGLFDEGQLLTTAASNSNGEVVIFPGEFMPSKKGRFYFDVKPLISTPRKFSKISNKLTKTFDFKVEGDNCEIHWNFNESTSAEYKDLWLKQMSVFGFEESNDGIGVDVAIKTSEEGKIDGLSSENSFVKISLESQLSVEGTELVLKSKGMGRNTLKALKNAFENARWKSEMATLKEKGCHQVPISKISLAVLPIEASNASSNLKSFAKTLQDELIYLSLKSGRIDVVERTKIKQVIDEQVLALSGIVEEADAVEVGVLSGAEVLLIGDLTSSSAGLILSIRIVNVSSGKILKGAKITAKTLKERESMAKNAFKELGLRSLNL